MTRASRTGSRTTDHGRGQPGVTPRFANGYTTYECCTPGCVNRTPYVYCLDCKPEEDRVPSGHRTHYNGREVKPMEAKFHRRCEYCGDHFMAKTNRAKYCPPPKKCAINASNERKRVERTAA